MKQLAQRWMTLFKPYASDLWIKHTWQQIRNLYQSPHRYYHNLQHITECLQQFDQVKSNCSEPFLVEVALWLHDVVYDPLAHDNELQSSHFATECLQQTRLTQDMIDQVVLFILLTQHPSHPSSNDEQYLLDIDLSILGAAPPRFAEYEQHIRQEYQHVPQQRYQEARKQLLQHLLDSTPLYHSDYFNQHLQQQAELNLQQAIAQLSLH